MSVEGLPQFLIVEDDPLVADGVKRVLEKHGQVEVVATIQAARETLARETPGRCMIVDVGLPDGSGLDLLEEHKALLDRIDVLVLTGMFERDLINRASMLGAHVALKPISASMLDDFVRSLVPRTAPVAARAKIVEREAARWKLTPREKEIVQLHVDGKTREEIIRELGISSKTYANHVTSILTKTDLANMSALAIRLLLEAQQASNAP
jgi:two-component system, LuxR family, response regulator FixJ